MIYSDLISVRVNEQSVYKGFFYRFGLDWRNPFGCLLGPRPGRQLFPAHVTFMGQWGTWSALRALKGVISTLRFSHWKS